MNFSVDKNILLNGINTVIRALPKKSIVPLLDGILFIAEGTTVTLVCTDLSLTIQTSFEAEITTTGSFVLGGKYSEDASMSGKFLSEIIRKMPNGIVNVSGDTENGVTIVSQGSKIKLMALSANDYPDLPRFNKDNAYKIPQGLLKQMINQTTFASAPDGFIRQILTGCLFEIEANSFNIVACDTVRLAIRNAYLDGENEPVRAVVPTGALNEISKILSDDDDTVDIYFKNNSALFDFGSTYVFTRLYEGEYIKYHAFIPQQSDIVFSVNRTALYEAIDRAWLMVRSNNIKYNYIVFTIGNGMLAITSRCDTGDVYEQVEINGAEKDLQIAFNAEFFVDCLKNLDDEEIKLCLTTNRAPCVVKPVDNDKKTYLILPVKM